MNNRIDLISDGRDKFRKYAEEGLLIRAGLATKEVIQKGNDYAGYGLPELMRECLRQANQPISRIIHENIARAMTSSDFPYLLESVANKSLFEGWDTQEETWQIWCGTGSVKDFKENSLVSMSEASDLEEVPEDTEYEYGKRTDAKETFRIATYGKIFFLSRQAIINDDLNAFVDIPRSHGEAASRKLGDVVYSVLITNAAMGDGKALFHADHGNLSSGGDVGAPGIATLSAGILAMKSQTDLQGLRKLNIRPEYFIAPVALEGASEVFFLSERFADSNTVATDSSLAATRQNPYSGRYFTRVYEPRLDDDSTAAWYLAGPKSKTVKVFFLGGIDKPFMDSQRGWNSDGIEYKVRIDAAAKALDYRALSKNPGA